jgi:hypothetical protein
MDNGGTIYTYNTLNDYNVASKAEIIGSEELLMKYGKAVWSIDNQGRLLMQRLLINIYTTRTVGQMSIIINPQYLTRIYEQDLMGKRGHILIFDKEGYFVPSMNQDINDIALLLF